MRNKANLNIKMGAADMLCDKKRSSALLLICYPKCTTCQKSKKWLDERKTNYTFRDIKENNPTYDELKEWLGRSGLPIKRFFNTIGLLYKSLSLKEKLPSMSENECLRLLATDGMLVKRPLVIADDFVLVGFKEDEWNQYLK
jgi:arsenate reductase